MSALRINPSGQPIRFVDLGPAAPLTRTTYSGTFPVPASAPAPAREVTDEFRDKMRAIALAQAAQRRLTGPVCATCGAPVRWRSTRGHWSHLQGVTPRHRVERAA